MLGWVITCHDDRAQDMLDCLEKKKWSAGAMPGGQFLARPELEYAEPHDV
ncbi:PTS system IIA component [Salmonella enterica subsp. arizonae]|uniref:PTS system IIA component n=1 Tax=Salmonella enterica subsp. arizonae TaxID=59203 RepID=A0A2X4TLF1_SALER|nr:PTS system IIA component [Salmonella enterica subsp. arizonae]